MAEERDIKLVITAVDRYTAALRKATAAVVRFASRAVREFVRVTRSVTGFVRGLFSLRRVLTTLAAGAAAGYGLKRLAGLFIDAGSVTEQLQVRLSALLGSQAEGARLFKEMADFAGRVPFEFRDVMAAATQLTGVMEGGVDQVRAWIPLIGDLAAVSGLSIQQATEQVIRMYSAGAASADLFRERGILAMLGFQAGVSVSAEETRKRLVEAWQDAGSKFRGVTDELAKTWEGKMSMLKDAWFQFKDEVAKAGFLDFAKETLDDILTTIEDLKTRGKLKIWAEESSKAMTKFFETLRDGFPVFLRLVGAVGWLVGKTVALTDFFAKVAAWMVVNAEAGKGVTFAWKDFGKEVENVGTKLPKVTVDIENAGGALTNFGTDTIDATKRIREALDKLGTMREEPEAEEAGPSLPPGFGDLEAMQTRLGEIEDWHRDRLRLLVLSNATQEQLQEAHENRLRALDEQTNQMKLQGVLATFGGMADASLAFAKQGEKQNKLAFGAYKAFAIAEALVSTYLSANKAMDDVPFPFNIAAAASIVALGLANVRKIASQKIGGGTGGGGTSGATSTGGGLPGSAVGQTVQAPELQQQPRALNVTFNIHSLDGRDINLEKLYTENLKQVIERDTDRGGTLRVTVEGAGT